jgi:hypothetical protein
MKIFGIRIMKESTYQSLLKKHDKDERHATAVVSKLLDENHNLRVAVARLRGKMR